jgi:hypothetical protein
VLSVHRSGRILVWAHWAHFAASAASRSMSLQGRPEVCLFLSLDVAIPPAAFPPCGCRVRRCEPRCHSALSSRGDYLTNVRLSRCFRDRLIPRFARDHRALRHGVLRDVHCTSLVEPTGPIPAEIRNAEGPQRGPSSFGGAAGIEPA